MERAAEPSGQGTDGVREQDQLEFGQFMMVYPHHERIDGTGYPVRLAGDEIHKWAPDVRSGRRL